jgi:hypothetical protein
LETPTLSWVWLIGDYVVGARAISAFLLGRLAPRCRPTGCELIVSTDSRGYCSDQSLSSERRRKGGLQPHCAGVIVNLSSESVLGFCTVYMSEILTGRIGRFEVQPHGGA